MSNLFEDFLLSNYSPSSSECIYQKKQQNHIVIAVIVNRGKVLAASSNKNGTRSNGSGYSDYTIHAERAVVKKLGDISKLRGAVMYVWRVSQYNVGLMSKPCHDCSIFLEKCRTKYGLRNVYYTQNPTFMQPSCNSDMY